jgi:transcriptional regulator with XRE-family HTH domain
MSPNNKSPRSPEERKTLNLLGAYIRKWREDKGLTQEQLAPIVGLTRSYITEIETGKRNISFLTLLKIIDVLGGDKQELLNLFYQIWLK